MIKLVDSVNTILQCLMVILIPNFCTHYRNKNSKEKLLFYIISLYLIVYTTTVLLGNSSLGAIFIHVVLILTGIIIFKEDSLGATITISIVYLGMITNVIISNNLFWGYFQYKVPANYVDVAYILFLYIPQYIMGIFILCRKDIIYKIYLFIRSKKISIVSLVLISVVGDFILSFNVIIHDLDNPIFKEIIFILLGLFIVGITIYFSNIENEAKEIALLNRALEEKINELKKVKHDYGAQISYLYGMYLMGKYDRLGESLKSIINSHNNITSEIKIVNNDSMLSMIVNGIEHKGINIIIDEQAPLSDTVLAEMEIQSVISNILRNSITAMGGKGSIKIRSYYNLNNIIIKIQNDGPKIGDNIIDKIFEMGFSTKENSNKEHGFGLAIVKEIIEKYNGKVSVTSSLEATEFIVKIPIKRIVV